MFLLYNYCNNCFKDWRCPSNRQKDHHTPAEDLIPVFKPDGSVITYARITRIDRPKITKYLWCLHPQTQRPVTLTEQGTIEMPQVIYELQKDTTATWEYVNGNPLDNRRKNIRLLERPSAVTKIPVRSKYRFVLYDHSPPLFLTPQGEPKKHWVAYGDSNGKYFYLGHHSTEEEAAAKAQQFREDGQNIKVGLDFSFPTKELLGTDDPHPIRKIPPLEHRLPHKIQQPPTQGTPGDKEAPDSEEDATTP